tara:strand:- start:3548 stop:3982 length:435 start_codon:yes stop_codon:yes gene_type:complete
LKKIIMSETSHKLSETLIRKVIESIKFDANGLVPAIAQDEDTKEVLMMAWMNGDAIKETLVSGMACYYSRSRSKLWRKGEESGHVQILKEFRIDCDADTILLIVDQKGVACHTGRPNCFFKKVDDGSIKIISEVLIDPKTVYKK